MDTVFGRPKKQTPQQGQQLTQAQLEELKPKAEKSLKQWGEEVEYVVEKLNLKPLDKSKEFPIFTVDANGELYQLSTVLKAIVERLEAYDCKCDSFVDLRGTFSGTDGIKDK